MKKNSNKKGKIHILNNNETNTVKTANKTANKTVNPELTNNKISETNSDLSEKNPTNENENENKINVDNNDAIILTNDETASEYTTPKQRKKRKMSLANILFRIFLIVVLIAGVVYGVKALITFSLILEPDTIQNAETEDIPLTTTGTLAYDNFHRGVIVANNGNVSYYNSKANLLWEVPGFDGSPVINVSDKYALVSYTGTPNALLFNGPDSLPITGTGNIVTACINENGYFALVMTEEGYKNQIVVFDNNGQVIYRWHSAENYITCVSIAPDNNGMTASTVNFSGSSFSGSVLIFEFNQDKPYTGQIEEDNLIMDIEYVSNKRIVVIGDKTTSYYKTNGDKITNIDYAGKKLTTFDVCDDGHTILCFAKDDSFMSNSDIYSYTSRGKQLGHYETNGRALSVSCSNKRILVARERQFDVLEEKCNKISTMAVLKDIKNSVLFDKGKYAFSVSGNTAQIIKVR